MSIKRAIAAVLFVCSVVSTGYGQDAVPTEILNRTLMIRTLNMQGTAFTVEYKGQLYLVTARHMVTGLPVEHPTIKIRHNDEWQELHAKRILLPSSPKVDIAIFDTGILAKQSFKVTPMDDGGGVTFGQQVWFLGYPFLEGLRSHLKNSPTGEVDFPFIKRGTLSAIDGSDQNAIVIYVDGFNNEGFSGGPIVYWDFKEHAYRICCVVMGYRNEDAKAAVNNQQVNTNILVNSGILIAYSIRHAIDAIKKADGATPSTPIK